MRNPLYFFYTKNRNKNFYISLYSVMNEKMYKETLIFEDIVLYMEEELEKVKKGLKDLKIDFGYSPCYSITSCPRDFDLQKQ